MSRGTEALLDEAKELAELLHAVEVAVVAITVFADGEVEPNLVAA